MMIVKLTIWSVCSILDTWISVQGSKRIIPVNKQDKQNTYEVRIRPVEEPLANV